MLHIPLLIIIPFLYYNYFGSLLILKGVFFMDLTFMKKFKPETRCIKEFKYWIVCVRPKQVTIGDAVILLKRETSSLGNILPEESAEFPEVIKWYEDVCVSKFGAIKFNYTVAMMHDSFVHYHAFPRYNKVINIFGKTWKDEEWPALVSFRNVPVEEDILQSIKNYMQS